MSELDPNPRRNQLRVSYVWRDEVMSDVIAGDRRKITVGARRGVTFVTPELGLPPKFPIIRRGSRGYLVTLGAGMTGRMSVGGNEVDVADFLARGGGDGTQGSFRATGVAPGDWGVIHLDGNGEHTIFFQFVKADPPLPRPTARDSHLMMPAVSFALILHASIVMIAIRDCGDPPAMAFPGKRDVMAGYLLNRPPPPPAPAPAEPQAGEKDAVEKEKPASTVGKEGKTGGKGDKPRAKAPDPDKGKPDELPKSVQVGLLSQKSRTEMRKVRERGGFDVKLGNAIERLRGDRVAGSDGGHGDGEGTGVGRGRGTGTSTRGGGGTGGGGKNLGDVQTHGPIDTGGTRAARGTPGGKGVKEVEVKVDTGTPDGELGGLTAAEILKVVRTKRNAIATCYERELQRQKNLGGKVVITWRINASGAVLDAKVRSTAMRNGKVEDCIVRQIQGLRFPQPRGGQMSKVNFPFLFAPR